MRFFLVVGLILFAVPVFGAEPPPTGESLPPGAKVKSLVVQPTTIHFTTTFASTQLIVTATLESGETVDVTRLAKFDASDSVKLSATGLARPGKAGSGTITVSLAGQSAKIAVTVPAAMDKPISFVTDVQPVLAKLGCNQGTCHGAAQGKSGFKLSLRGYDPILDHRALTDDLEGRRFNRTAPDRSLMLLKPAGAIAHTGGIVWTPNDPNYELVKKWIADGVKLDLTAPRVTSLEVIPAAVTVPIIGMKQQFAVIATYTDGRKRDVTAEAFLDSSNTEVATVDKASLITTVRRGEATMLARYEGAYAAAAVVVMGDRGRYQWKPRPVNNFIDALVDTKLQRLKIQASDFCTDEEFLRRVSLDLTGLPPTSETIRKFIADMTPMQKKRDALINSLVGSEAYIDHWTNKWGDMLQINRKFLGDGGATALRTWTRAAIAKNVPYDQFAYGILAAKGSNLDNPPAAYYKTLRTPDAVMENTTQLFLAIRFNCNKCHDHPFEKWTQDQYYETSAYFAQVGRTEDPKFKGQKIGGSAVEGSVPLVEIISDGTTGEMKHDRTGANAPPKFPFAVPGFNADAKAARREQIARWITAKDNPYFAKSYVNRIWSYLTGVGIIEPVDDIRAGNPATNPELLDRLTAEFVAGGYDTQKLMKTIAKSRTYQLSIATNQWNKDDDMNYSHATPRRLPAEVLFDAIHAATGAKTRLPGLPVGARAAQLLDGNVDLPGGFLDLLGKPVRESACECERSNTMMLGPVLAMVNGPIVGDAIKDPSNHIVTFTEKTKEDTKVIEEIYLSVLNRRPTAKELEIGVKALTGSKDDHAALTKDFTKRKAAFDAYAATVPSKLPAYEKSLLELKPTAWTTFTPAKMESKAGVTLAAADVKTGSTLTVQKDGSILVTGRAEAFDLQTLTAELKLDAAITGIRLEVLADDSLPARGPGRALNGNFVLNEFTVTAMLPTAAQKPVPVKLVHPEATFGQDTFPVANAIDGNVATGWAIAPQFGSSQTAIFSFEKPVNAKLGVTLAVSLDQRFGTAHNIGKFRLSYTADKKPRLASPVPADLLKIVETESGKRTPEQVAKLTQAYLATDAEYQRLQRDVPAAPPVDARVLGAQDLTWALINTPSFLFNR